MSNLHQAHGSPQPYGATREILTPDPLPPGHVHCPCGRAIKPWFRGRGVGHAIWFGFFSPLITLVLYALIVGLALSDDVAQVPGATVVLLCLVPVIYLVMLLVLGTAGKHRGMCLVKRSLVWFAVGPGALISAIATALP